MLTNHPLPASFPPLEPLTQLVLSPPKPAPPSLPPSAPRGLEPRLTSPLIHHPVPTLIFSFRTRPSPPIWSPYHLLTRSPLPDTPTDPGPNTTHQTASPSPPLWATFLCKSALLNPSCPMAAPIGSINRLANPPGQTPSQSSSPQSHLTNCLDQSSCTFSPVLLTCVTVLYCKSVLQIYVASLQ